MRQEKRSDDLVRRAGFGISLFFVCLIGICSQPYLGLSAFWPANAYMLGLLVRFPRLNNRATWLCCSVAFFMADLVTGVSLARNIALNCGNLAAVATACLLLGPLSQKDRILTGQESTRHIFGAILAASLVAGLFGIVVNPLLFVGTSGEGFLFWTATEMVNYVTFLPMLLTLPEATAWNVRTFAGGLRQLNPRSLLPLAALAASLAGGALAGGPGAALFPIPALLWCGLEYRLFPTACISLMFALWTLFALRTGMLWAPTPLTTRGDLISVRLGISLVAFTPIIVANLVAARNELLARLRLLADHDPMTGLPNRRAFFESGTRTLGLSVESRESVAVMMLDIDHFKSVNDRYGHKAGDQVLVAFGSLLTDNLRAQDIVGRIGGEEFAVVLPDCGVTDAAVVAQRINQALRSATIVVQGKEAIRATVSIGIHAGCYATDLEEALAKADTALYAAKNFGRDRYVIWSEISVTHAKPEKRKRLRSREIVDQIS
ncbi:diguanylate cyclase [Sphingobium sp. AP49]|uniref:GGDEF domain-containing protein n=1 Tax=Sphingobium sp. AP49 TaxID=1144307 RepID=UPI00026EDAD0|nr:GGDEF domain-containing protein [Sphingobium sp. AP49]WHO38879.1 diguanylate cyclase [Sphingobium sp. AP49]